MTGTTTVLGIIAKPNLIPWAARVAVEFIQAAVQNGIPLTDEIFADAKVAHTKKKEEAGVAGTDTHALVEEWVKTCVAQKALVVSTEDAKSPIFPFIQWAVANSITFLASEKRVYSKEWFVAGTYDMKFEMNGLTYIADVKTQKAIYDRTPFAQMAAYQYMEGEMGEPKVDGRIIIHMPRERVFNPDSDVYLSEHYEDDLKLFQAALEIYRNLNNRFEPLSTYKNK